MEPDRKLATATLQALITLLRIEEKRLVEVLTFAELPERRTQAEAGLERVREKIDASAAQLAGLEHES